MARKPKDRKGKGNGSTSRKSSKSTKKGDNRGMLES